ncbi:MAG: hypothetical protein JL50_04660 [Peptococcaceae bacterium BICA1-7]|nr:MAG: hypothetical protein JL50_04660 [Peptococcaceae bacterium BICA1-7]HBV95914.1 hypothetical protein [Desulfotomaculum sp.]
MARVLFLPALLIVLAIMIFLALRVRSMFIMSRSRDIVLSRAVPYEGDLPGLMGQMLDSVKALPRIEYQSDMIVNFRKLTSYSRTESNSGYSRIKDRSKVVEINRDNAKIAIKGGKADIALDAGENQWFYYWCGVSPLDEFLKLFYESGIKIKAGDTGLHTERKYIELLMLSHALPDSANESFEKCFPAMSAVYGKDLSRPDARVRNLMVRILVNSLTSMPDYIETKFNVFNGENEFVCDYMQNSRLLY